MVAQFDHASLVIGLGIIMFYLLEFGLRLQPYSNKQNDPMNKFKLIFIIGSFLVGLGLAFLLYGLAVDYYATPNVIQNAFIGTMTLYSTLTVIAVFGLLIYFLLWIPKAYKAAIFNKDDGEDFEE